MFVLFVFSKKGFLFCVSKKMLFFVVFEFCSEPKIFLFFNFTLGLKYLRCYPDGMSIENAGTELFQNSRWDNERSDVLYAAQTMADRKLVLGSSGNVSYRLQPATRENLMAITPSGRAYSDLTSEDIVVIDFEGEPIIGDHIPSTESMAHAAIYLSRKDVGAVMHTHSPYASAVAVAGLAIPPIVDEMVIILGGGIEVTEYASPSSEDLAANIVTGLGNRKAVLVRNHGLVGVGKTPSEALYICSMVEHLAQIFISASKLGKISTLPEEIVEVEKALYAMRLKAEYL